MSEVKRYWIYKGTSNFCQVLTMNDDYTDMVKQKPDGFYDIVSTNDTVEGGVEVVLASEYEKLKAQLERVEKVLDFYSDCGNWGHISYDKADYVVILNDSGVGDFQINDITDDDRVGVDAGMLMVGDPCYFVGSDATIHERCKTWEQACDQVFCKEDFNRDTPMASALRSQQRTEMAVTQCILKPQTPVSAGSS